MVYFIFGGIQAYLLFLAFFRKKEFALFFVLSAVAVDILLPFFPVRFGIVPLVAYSQLFSIIVFLKGFIFKVPRAFLLLFVYLLIVVLINGDKVAALVKMSNISSVFLMLPVGLMYKNEMKFDNKLLRVSVIILSIIILYILLIQVFKFEAVASRGYSDFFIAGAFYQSKINIVAFCIVIVIGLTNFNQKFPKIFLNIITVVLGYLIILLNMKRSTIIISIFGTVALLMFNKKNLLIGAILSVLMTFIFSFSGTFEEIFSQQLKARGDKVQVESIEKEGRYLEYLHITEYISLYANNRSRYLGNGFSGSNNFGLLFYGRERAIHTDYIFLVYTTGIIGIALFLFLMYKVIRLWISTYLARIRKKQYDNRRLHLSLALLLMVAVLPVFGGTFVSIGGTSLAYFTIGYCLSNAFELIKKTRSNPNEISGNSQ